MKRGIFLVVSLLMIALFSASVSASSVSADADPWDALKDAEQRYTYSIVDGEVQFYVDATKFPDSMSHREIMRHIILELSDSERELLHLSQDSLSYVE